MRNQKRIVLVASVGHSPQVLTGMVWELAHLPTPVVPDEIVVLADGRAARKLKADVLEGARSVWQRLLDDLTADGLWVEDKLLLGSTRIRVFPDVNGDEAEDLRTSEDNLRAADFILQQLRQYTESPDVDLVVSIAGGRKTTSALLLSCMTLLGRENDRVYHLLQSPEYEGREGSPMYGASELFEVPYVRMRGWYHERFKSVPPSYRTLVSKVQTLAPPPVVSPKLEIDFDGYGYVRVLPSRTEIRLSAPAFLLIVLIAKGLHRDSWGDVLYRLRDRLLEVDFPMTVKWNDRFIEGPKFVKDGTQKENAGDLADCMSELRKKLAIAGFDNPEVLAPKRNGIITYPRANFSMINEALIPKDIRGCLLAEINKKNKV